MWSNEYFINFSVFISNKVLWIDITHINKNYLWSSVIYECKQVSRPKSSRTFPHGKDAGHCSGVDNTCLLLLFIAINPFPQNNSVYNSIIRYRNVYWNIVAFVTCMYTVGVVSGLTSTIYLSPTWEYFI